jgi:hypothetical protein
MTGHMLKVRDKDSWKKPQSQTLANLATKMFQTKEPLARLS